MMNLSSSPYPLLPWPVASSCLPLHCRSQHPEHDLSTNIVILLQLNIGFNLKRPLPLFTFPPLSYLFLLIPFYQLYHNFYPSITILPFTATARTHSHIAQTRHPRAHLSFCELLIPLLLFYCHQLCYQYLLLLLPLCYYCCVHKLCPFATVYLHLRSLHRPFSPAKPLPEIEPYIPPA